jgi:methylmalonyl-CoA/ethylmalonyl-CoA epimerase
MNIHHIGYAVHSVIEAAERLKSLGYDVCSSIFEDEKRNVQILFVENGQYRVELLSPLDTSHPSPIDGILLKKTAGPYHFCYEVKCLNESIEMFKRQGAVIIALPSWAGAIDANVCFLFDKTLGIIELLEKMS